MLLNFVMIVLGIVTVLWSRFVLPRQMRQVSVKTRGRPKERYDEHMQSSTITWMAVAPTVMGGILILLGLLLWLTE